MEPHKVPEISKRTHPLHRFMSYGPPPGISDEDCGTIEALQGRVEPTPGQRAFDGAPEIRVYWKPDARDMRMLLNGGVVELNLTIDRLVPHYMAVVLDKDE